MKMKKNALDLMNIKKNKKLLLILLVLAILAISAYLFFDKNQLNNKAPQINTRHNIKEGFQGGVLSAEDLTPRNGETIVALFYAEWCGYCKKFKPVFNQAKKQMDNSNKKVRLVSVDCDVNKELSKQYEVNGYPTIILIRDGEETVLEAERNYEGFMKQLKQL